MAPERSRSAGLAWRVRLLWEQLLLVLELLLVQPAQVVREGRRRVEMIRLRLGGYPAAKARGGIWIHAPAMGELTVADALIKALPPTLPVVITTAYNRFRNFEPTSAGPVDVTYPPYHFGRSARRFFRAYEPRALVQIEAKAWSLVLARLGGLPIPTCVINVFLGERHLAALKSGVLRPLLLDVDRFGVQEEAEMEALVALGIPPDRVAVTGSLKFDIADPPANVELERRLSRLAGGRPVLVAGSVHVPEAGAVLEGFQRCGGGTRALLVLAPRQPVWSAEMEPPARRLGLVTARRSALPDVGRADVVILDSEGELPALYRLAAAAFIGGSLFPWGGHNPLEAARFGVPVAVGPHTRHFQTIAGPFDRACAWKRVSNGSELGAAWKAWLDDPGAAAALGRKGQAIAQGHQGALARTLALLQPILGLAEATAARGRER